MRAKSTRPGLPCSARSRIPRKDSHMFEDNDAPALLMLPDGRQLEWSRDATSIRRFKMPRLPYPYGFEIDGQRYHVDTIQAFPYLPGRDGSQGGPMLFLELVEFGPPAN